MNFKIDELGDLSAIAELKRRLFTEANWYALARFGGDLKSDLRDDVRASGIKRASRLAGSWRGRMFPISARDHAQRPAYVIGTNAPNVVETLEDGPTITAHGGGLLVPIGPARRIKLRIGQPRTDLPREALRMYGASRFVSMRLKRTRELALGVFAADGGTRRFIPLFILRKSVKAPKLLHARAIIERAGRAIQSRLPDETFREFEKRLYNSPAGKDASWRTTFDSRTTPFGARAAGRSR